MKNWEKQYSENGSHIFKLKDGSRSLIIRKYKDSEKWDLFTTAPYVDLEKHIIDKHFKSEALALKFAKKYMRAHPNG